MYRAVCRGGPYDEIPHYGQGVKGVVFVDKQNDRVDVYDLQGDVLIYRFTEGRYHALERLAVSDPGRDVRAVPYG